jgi:2-polyprenyl-3-methyl-5-hydroxy-6-metoxy-1,4-benzoquinol methylase
MSNQGNSHGGDHMATQVALDRYLDTIVQLGLYRKKQTLRYHMESVFRGVDLRDKTVIDIGAGSGIYSHYAACMGAKEVVSLEPEADGSSPRMRERFLSAQKALGLTNVTLQPLTFQEFNPNGMQFDVLLLHSSINHLNEQACIRLLESESARATYHAIFSKLASLACRGAILIAEDTSRSNVFAPFNVRNPLARDIEWHKHQSPRVWAALLGECGFVNPSISWPSFNTLGNAGRFLFGNKVISFLTISSFHLTMEKS